MGRFNCIKTYRVIIDVRDFNYVFNCLINQEVIT